MTVKVAVAGHPPDEVFAPSFDFRQSHGRAVRTGRDIGGTGKGLPSLHIHRGQHRWLGHRAPRDLTPI